MARRARSAARAGGPPDAGCAGRGGPNTAPRRSVARSLHVVRRGKCGLGSQLLLAHRPTRDAHEVRRLPDLARASDRLVRIDAARVAPDLAETATAFARRRPNGTASEPRPADPDSAASPSIDDDLVDVHHLGQSGEATRPPREARAKPPASHARHWQGCVASGETAHSLAASEHSHLDTKLFRRTCGRMLTWSLPPHTDCSRDRSHGRTLGIRSTPLQNRSISSFAFRLGPPGPRTAPCTTRDAFAPCKVGA